MTDRYTVVNRSVSAHCCFEFTVIDTQRSSPQIEQTVCECFEKDDAELIARALNSLTEGKT